MKNILLFAFLLLLCKESLGQQIAEENIPIDVTSEFKNKYSSGEKPVWQMDYDNYVVEFTFLKTPLTATFDKNGRWVETLSYISTSDLPKEVKDSLNRQFGIIFNTFQIEEAIKIERPETEQFYQLVINQNLSTYDVQMNENGKIIKMEKRTEESERKIEIKLPNKNNRK